MIRNLKIQPNLILNSQGRCTKIFPKLILSGKWLLDAGFNPNQQIQVQILHGQLLISPLETLIIAEPQSDKYKKKGNKK